MLWVVVAAALLCALAWRIRGTAWGKWPGRAACALLVSLPVALHWPWGTAAWLPVAGLSLVMLARPRNPAPATWRESLTVALHGLGFTVPTAAALAALVGPGSLGAWLLVGAGLAEGATQRLPPGPAPDLKYLWRELAFGACWGAAVGFSL